MRCACLFGSLRLLDLTAVGDFTRRMTRCVSMETMMWGWVVGSAILFAASAARAEPDYQRDIKPILEKRCYSCHSRLKQKSDLRLDAGALIHKGGKHGPVIERGPATNSELIKRVTASNEDDRMPPEGKPLSVEQVELLKNWIDAGARY